MASAEDIQAEAIAQVLVFTFRVVVHPKYFAVVKPHDISKARKKLLSEASILRRIAKTEWINDAETLCRVAVHREQAAADLPSSTSPRVIRNDRGDRIARGVQIRISELLMEHFGERLDGTAATLTAVALGTGGAAAEYPGPPFQSQNRQQKADLNL